MTMNSSQCVIACDNAFKYNQISNISHGGYVCRKVLIFVLVALGGL